jgi:hypothetical protein
VIVHGRSSGHGRPKSRIAADILRIVDGVLVEHWDVLHRVMPGLEPDLHITVRGELRRGQRDHEGQSA